MSSFSEAAMAEIEALFGNTRQGRFITTQQAVTPYEDPIGPGQINPVGFIAPNSLTQIDLFGSLIRPPVVVTSLPALPDVLYPVGSFAFLTTNAKLYRNTDGSTWSAAVAASDLTGHIGIPIAAADPTLPDATNYPAGSYYWNSVSHVLRKTANGTTWINAIEAADIVANTITAGQIAAATITGTEIAALTITAANIAANTITAAKIAADTITAGEIAAGAITASELAALSVTAAKLNILDAAGATVLTGAGFAGSWLDFVAMGVYNDHFEAGSTSNITAATIVGTASTEADYLASQSADIPLWVVSAESGAGTFKRIADATAEGGFALQWDGNEDATVFQDVPVIPGNIYSIFLNDRAITAGVDLNTTTSGQYRTSIHAAVGAAVTAGGDYDALLGLPYLLKQTVEMGVAPPSAKYLRTQVQTRRIAGAPTYWLNGIMVQRNLVGPLRIDESISNATPALKITQGTDQTRLWSYSVDIGVSTDANSKMDLEDDLISWGPGGATALDAYIRRSAAKTLKFSSDGSSTALTAVILAGATPLQFSTDAYIRRSDAKTLTIDSDGAGTALTKLAMAGALETHGGTSFPASPATNDLFYRTDLGMWYFYSAGIGWLTCTLFTMQGEWWLTGTPGSISATTGSVQHAVIPNPLGTTYGTTIYVDSYVQTAYVNGGTALSGSHKWVGTTRWYGSAGTTTLATTNINSGASSIYRVFVTAVNAVFTTTALIGVWETDWAKTGTPGPLFPMEVLTYRWVL